MPYPPLEHLQRAIRTDTRTSSGRAQYFEMVKQISQGTGIRLEEVTLNNVKSKSLSTLILGYPNRSMPEHPIVFHSVIDTPDFVQPSPWEKTGGDPFRATRVRDRFYGLGSTGGKIDFLCKLWALSQTRGPHNPTLLIGSLGGIDSVARTVDFLKSRQILPKGVMIGSPTNLELVYSQKGNLVFSLDMPLQNKIGRSFQKSWKIDIRPPFHTGETILRRGLFEIYKRRLGLLSIHGGTGSDVLADECKAELCDGCGPETDQIFRVLAFFDDESRELRRRKDLRYNPSTSKLYLNLTGTENGRVYFTYDFRYLPDLDIERTKARWEQAVKKFGGLWRIVHSIEPLRGRRSGPLFLLAQTALKSCGVSPKPTTAQFTSGAVYYNKLGVQALVFGSGHNVDYFPRNNEFNSMTQVRIATQFYAKLMQSLQ